MAIADDAVVLDLRDDLDRDRPVMVFCRSGIRSLRASRMLEEMGFTRIFDLEGGFLAWQEEEGEE